MFVACTALGLAPQAWAQDDVEPKVDLSGLFFGSYSVDVSEGADLANEFDLDRAYFTAKSKLGDRLSTRLTLDVGREKEQDLELTDPADPTQTVEVTVPENERIRVFVKYAYLEWKPSALDGVKLRFGMAGTMFPGLYDKLWGQRFASKSFTDQFKLLSTSDLGIHASGKHVDGIIDWHLAVVNGEGYTRAEVDASKTVQARFTVDPLGPNEDMRLPITGTVSYEVDPNGNATDMVAGGALGLQHTYVTLWGEGLIHSEGPVSGTGISATAMPVIPDILNVYGRIDLFDPDSSTDGDDVTRLVTGVSRSFTDSIKAAIQFENEAEGNTSEQVVSLRMYAGF